MISVDLIGQIRRAYFEQGRPIKEIVRALSVSRATVRKVVRDEGTTQFRYTARAAQPSPKLGPWIKDLVEILEAEASCLGVSGVRRSVCSRRCGVAVMRARMTAYTGTPRHGAAISGGRRRTPICRCW